MNYPGPPSLCPRDAPCDSPFQPNCDNRTRPPSRPAPSPFAGRTVTPSASSHSACLRVAAGFARGEISPELATTRCHGTKSGLRVGRGKGSSAFPLRADSGSGRYGFDSRAGSTLSAAPTLLIALPDQHETGSEPTREQLTSESVAGGQSIARFVRTRRPAERRKDCRGRGA